MSASAWGKGSDWQRWDPHIHTPITVLQNGYSKPVDWSGYIKAINDATPAANALGITDYLSIDAYEIMRTRWLDGELPGVQLLFPNVEFRITVQTKDGPGINIHLLFSPDDPEHISLIKEKLPLLLFDYNGQPYSCNREGLIRLGKAVDPAQTNADALYRTGVNQFKIEFGRLRKWYDDDDWLKRHCLVALCAGQNDGASGLQNDGGFLAFRKELQRFAHIVFSPRPSDRRYWLGQGADSEKALVAEYGGCKPCLHGCDAHELARVLAPDGERRCWIKAEPTFEGLRQTLLEPEERVFIGQEAPTRGASYYTLDRCCVENAPWLHTTEMPLNQGLITIIGPRGSGKTALAELIAVGAHSYGTPGEASFLQKAGDLASGAHVTLVWGNDENDAATVGDIGSEDEFFTTPRIRYLSQHFVEQLCNAQGLDDKLLSEIEKVIFESLDETDRLDAQSFRDLRDLKTTPLRQEQDWQRSAIRTASREIAGEDRLLKSLPQKHQAMKDLDKEIDGHTKQLNSLIAKGNEGRQAEWQKLNTAAQAVEATVTGLKRRKQTLGTVAEEVGRIRNRAHEDWTALPRRFPDAGLTEAEWNAFRQGFVGNPSQVVANAISACDGDLKRVSEGPWADGVLPEKQTLAALRAAIAKLEKELKDDTERLQKYARLKELIDRRFQDRQRLMGEINHIGQSDQRRKAAAERRFTSYRETFDLLAQEQSILEALYAPLHDWLDARDDAAKALTFYVHRRVLFKRWCKQGEALIDLRKEGPFQGEGTLEKRAREMLLPAWLSGSQEDVVAAMRQFLGVISHAPKDPASYLTTSGTLENFASWLFSTDHIEITYGIRYEGVPIERLSPGTRGIVLLILYLAVDQKDTRPLLIDQPEENLDPKSVFDVLVTFVRRARRRRQVILVTHNPNLVVNTDAEQVIVASAKRENLEELPAITYEAGPLEDLRIRKKVCDILEGGADAFRQRERRYAMQRLAAWWRDADGADSKQEG